MRDGSLPDTAPHTEPVAPDEDLMPAPSASPLPGEHPTVAHGNTGILMVNLGTPDEPTYGAVRRYLAEFLSDTRVIEVPKLLWLPVLYGPILTFRPAKAAAAYRRIWDHDKGESPLRTIARDQAEDMQRRMGEKVPVVWAFRYGNPSIEQGLIELKKAGCDRILIAALYPHYSATTTASVHDAVFDVLKRMRWQPAIRTLPPYFDDPAYIDALKGSVEEELAGLDFEPDRIIASYHSIPKSYWDNGDPYPCHCKKTSRLLKEAMGLPEGMLDTTYQSRVGPTEWVGPYTDKYVEKIAEEGVKKLVVLAPAFSADCLETLEEINMELRDDFMEHGGTHFHYIKCLNATDRGMEMLEGLMRRELKGWTEE